MQKAKPTDATGVTVTLSVYDANGNYRTIGTAQSDSSGMFSYAWAPDIEGQYTVVATFEGTNSYYGTSAESSFYAMNTPATATPQPTAVPSAADLYFLPAIVGLFVLIVVGIAVLAILMTRKP